MSDIEAKVPCNGCTICCQGDLIIIEKQEMRNGAVRMDIRDDASEYLTQTMSNGDVVLQHQKNGDCIYLDRKKGCTIHDRRPLVCREFDCARLVKTFTRRSRQRLVEQHPHMADVFWRGRSLLRRGYKPDNIPLERI